MEPWKEIAKSIVDTIKIRAGDFWDKNQEARDFVQERASRLAKLTFEYGIAADDAQREAVKMKMALVAETIETELLSIALIGQEQAKATFREIVSTVMSVVSKIIPVVFGAI
jgi:hypothetical protein